MSNRLKQNPEAHKSNTYQIRVKGHLGNQWADWFNGLTIGLEDNGDTLLTGAITDQAALYGLLKLVRDTGLTLVSVNCVDPDGLTAPGTSRADASDFKP